MWRFFLTMTILMTTTWISAAAPNASQTERYNKAVNISQTNPELALREMNGLCTEGMAQACAAGKKIDVYLQNRSDINKMNGLMDEQKYEDALPIANDLCQRQVANSCDVFKGLNEKIAKNKAVKLLQKGDDPAAVAILTPLCNSGDKQSCDTITMIRESETNAKKERIAEYEASRETYKSSSVAQESQGQNENSTESIELGRTESLESVQLNPKTGKACVTFDRLEDSTDSYRRVYFRNSCGGNFTVYIKFDDGSGQTVRGYADSLEAWTAIHRSKWNEKWTYSFEVDSK